MRIIAGTARSLPLKTIEGLDTRPTTDKIKETLFNMLQADIPGCYFLDLFAGSGQMGIEALSRGAERCVFVDAREEACRLIRENLKRTKLFQEAEVVRGDYMDYLNRCRERFSIIFLDPPYAEEYLENAIKRITEIDILQTDGIIVAERPLGKELPWEFDGYQRSKDYKYGKTLLTIYRKL